MEELKIRVRERLLCCPVCLDEYQDPRWLPCLHSVCFQCLEQLKNTSISSRLIQCPQCRATMSVSQGFPSNFLINSLKEEIASNITPKLCEACSKTYCFAKYHCKECDMDLCGCCSTEHNLYSHMGSVEDLLVSLDLDYPDLKENSQAECLLHVEEYLQMYCITCQKAICIQCYYQTHHKHKTKPLKELIKKFKDTIREEFDSLETVKYRLDFQLSKVNVLRNEISKSCEKVINEIYYERDLLLEDVQAAVNTQVQKVSSWQNQAIDELNKHHLKMKTCYNNIERGDKVLQQIKDSEVNLPTVQAFDRYLTMIKTEQTHLQCQTFIVKDIKFHKTLRFRIRPFFWAFFGYPSYKSRSIDIFPKVKKIREKHNLLLSYYVLPFSFLLQPELFSSTKTMQQRAQKTRPFGWF